LEGFEKGNESERDCIILEVLNERFDSLDENLIKIKTIESRDI